MATGSRLASRLIGTRIITGGEQTMNSLTLFTSRTHTQTQTRSQTHRHCLKRTVTRFQYGEQETLPLWFDLSRKKVWEKSTAAYLNILYTRKQRKTNDFNIFSSEFEILRCYKKWLLELHSKKKPVADLTSLLCWAMCDVVFVFLFLTVSFSGLGLVSALWNLSFLWGTMSAVNCKRRDYKISGSSRKPSAFLCCYWIPCQFVKWFQTCKASSHSCFYIAIIYI